MAFAHEIYTDSELESQIGLLQRRIAHWTALNPLRYSGAIAESRAVLSDVQRVFEARKLKSSPGQQSLWGDEQEQEHPRGTKGSGHGGQFVHKGDEGTAKAEPARPQRGASRFEKADEEHYISTIKRNREMTLRRPEYDDDDMRGASEWNDRREKEYRRSFKDSNVHLVDVPVELLNIKHDRDVSADRQARLDKIGGSDDPIMASLNGASGKLRLEIEDGNNRAAWALKNGRKTVPAFVHDDDGRIEQFRQQVHATDPDKSGQNPDMPKGENAGKSEGKADNPDTNGQVSNPQHAAISKRFGIPEAAVRSILETPVEELRRRDEDSYKHPNYAGENPAQAEQHLLGTAKLDKWNTNPHESYVEFLHEHDPKDLVTSEAADGIQKRDPSYAKYVEWFKQGHEPPPITTTENEKAGGKVVSSNRRRVLAAQEAGVKSIKAWHAVQNRETGLPLKYKDVLGAAREAESGQKVDKQGSGSSADKPAEPPKGTKAIAEHVAQWSDEQKIADWKKSGVKSLAFKSFFGDWEHDPTEASKVVNDKGEPQETHEIKAVFHGTSKDFDSFSERQIGDNGLAAGTGFYFAEDRRVAETYSKGTIGKPGGRVLECYLSIRKPFNVDGMYDNGSLEHLTKVAESISEDAGGAIRREIGRRAEIRNREGGGLHGGELYTLLEHYFSQKGVNKFLERCGYDGLVHTADDQYGTPNWEEGRKGRYGKVWVAFSPTQIKSTDNRGTFSATSPKLAESRVDWMLSRPPAFLVRNRVLESAPAGEKWITLHSGAHVRIREDGTITAGFGKGKKVSDLGDKESDMHPDEQAEMQVGDYVPVDWQGNNVQPGTRAEHEATIQQAHDEGYDISDIKIHRAGHGPREKREEPKPVERPTHTPGGIPVPENPGELDPGGAKWQDPPQELYHATFSGNDILQSGLKRSSDVGSDKNVLGGAVKDFVSLTTLDNARIYRDGMETARQAARGELPWTRDMARQAAVHFGVSPAKAERMYDEEMRSLQRKDSEPPQRWFNFLQAVSFEGKKFPLFMGGSWPQTVENADKAPQIIKVAHKGAQQWSYNPRETEWRVHDPHNLRVSLAESRVMTLRKQINDWTALDADRYAIEIMSARAELAGYGRLLESAAEGEAIVLDDVEDVRQTNAWSCGAAAACAVGTYFGAGPDNVDDWAKNLGTTKKHGTPPQAIIDEFQRLGLEAEGRHDMTVEDLADCLRDGKLIICPVQDYDGTRDEADHWDDGHYLTVVGVIDAPPGFVIAQDSSKDNADHVPGGSVSKADEDTEWGIEAAGRVLIRQSDWEDAWHDRGEDGTRYVNYGIVVGKPSGNTKLAESLRRRISDWTILGADRYALEIHAARVELQRVLEAGFDESQHPRGHAGNPGEFANKSEGEQPDHATQVHERKPSVTDTPQFKQWFGQSKIVGKDGKPLVVYHGTQHEFDGFDNTKHAYDAGIYVSPDAEYSSGYATSFSEMSGRDAPTGARVLPVYVSMQKPFFMAMKGPVSLTTNPDGTVDATQAGYGALDPESISNLKKAGYDGIVNGMTEYEYENGEKSIQDADEIVLFDAPQIKSATGNRGTFDPKSQKITESWDDFLCNQLIESIVIEKKVKFDPGQRRFDWKEDLHPRAKDGEFSKKGEGEANATEPTTNKPTGDTAHDQRGPEGTPGDGAKDQPVPGKQGAADGPESRPVEKDPDSDRPARRWKAAIGDKWPDDYAQHLDHLVSQLPEPIQKWMESNQAVFRYTTKAEIDSMPPGMRGAFVNAAAVTWNSMRIHFMEDKVPDKRVLQHEMVHLAYKSIPDAALVAATEAAIDDGNKIAAFIRKKEHPDMAQEGIWDDSWKLMRKSLNMMGKSKDQGFSIELSLMMPDHKYQAIAKHLGLKVDDVQYLTLAVHLAMAEKAGALASVPLAYRSEEPAAYRAGSDDEFAASLFKYSYEPPKGKDAGYKPVLDKRQWGERWEIRDKNGNLVRWPAEGDHRKLTTENWDEAQKLADEANELFSQPAKPTLPTLPKAIESKTTIIGHDDPEVQKHIEHVSVIPESHLQKMAEFMGGLYIGDKPVTEQDDMGHLKGQRPRGWRSGTWDVVAGCGPGKKGDPVVLGKGRAGTESLAWHEMAHALDYAMGKPSGSDDAKTLRKVIGKRYPYCKHPEEAFAEGYALWMAAKTGRLKTDDQTAACGTWDRELRDAVNGYFDNLKVA